VILIKRDLETDPEKWCAPLTWRWAKDNEGMRHPIIVDSFRHNMQISKHTIAPDGTVSPSVVCDYKGCTFHEFIKLEGYP
jgi:hypothetical protein